MKVELCERHLLEPKRLPLGIPGLLLAYDSWEPAELGRAQAEVLARTYDRSTLVDALAARQERLGADAAALANLEKLRDPRCTVVVANQAPGLFTGPLATIYKAITVVRLAEACTKRLGQPVVPVFCLATDSGDADDCSRCEFTEQTLKADFPPTEMVPERLPAAGLAPLVASFLMDIRDEERRRELTAMLAIDAGTDYGLYASAVLARIFAGTGLLVVEPRLWRPLQAAALGQVLAQRRELRARLDEAGGRVREAGLDVPFVVGDDLGLAHLDAAGIRRSVRVKGANFLLDGELVDEAALAARLAAAPQEFAPAPWLAPVLQALALPVLACVTDPDEWRDYLQLRGLFQLFEVPMPVVRLRNHATLLTPREQRLALQLHLQVADYFRPATDFLTPVELPEVPAQALAEAMTTCRRAIDALSRGLEGYVSKRDVMRLQIELQEELLRLKERATENYAQRQEVGNARIEKLFVSLRPRSLPQEAVLNVLPFLLGEGPGLIRGLLAQFDPFEMRHYVVSLGAE